MSRIIGVLSGKGGVGKTVTSVNIGAALHAFGQENTIVDADVSSANLTIHLGLPDAAFALQDVLNSEAHVFRALRILPSGLRIVPSSVSIEKSVPDLSRIGEVLRDLQGIVIVDFPPGFNKDVYTILESCDDLLLVTNPDIPAVTDTVKMVEIAKKTDANVLGIVINRVQGDTFEITPDEIERICETPVLSTVPEDINVKRAIFERLPLVHYSPLSPASVEFKRLSSVLIGRHYSPPSYLFLRRLLNLGE